MFASLALATPQGGGAFRLPGIEIRGDESAGRDTETREETQVRRTQIVCGTGLFRVFSLVAIDAKRSRFLENAASGPGFGPA